MKPWLNSWTDAQRALIRDKKCPRCLSELELRVSARFKSRRSIDWGKDGYAYTDLEPTADNSEVRCPALGAVGAHFYMPFADWQAL